MMKDKASKLRKNQTDAESALWQILRTQDQIIDGT
ncbi:MAG TPA: DUF559 domain-containing protein [Leucothrix sp.]|nr:DUF559 domain-containing protein [Leucothrix sp.]